jgi:hypothetical protein
MLVSIRFFTRAADLAGQDGVDISRSLLAIGPPLGRVKSACREIGDPTVLNGSDPSLERRSPTSDRGAPPL